MRVLHSLDASANGLAVDIGCPERSITRSLRVNLLAKLEVICGHLRMALQKHGKWFHEGSQELRDVSAAPRCHQQAALSKNIDRLSQGGP